MAIFFSRGVLPLPYLSVRHLIPKLEYHRGRVAVRMRNPSHFSSKAFYVGLLTLENILRNKHWKRAVPDPN